MTDFVTISEGISAKAGNIKGVIIQAGDLKSGTKDGNDWTRKDFVIEDKTGSLKITAWNDDIKLFHLGNIYEITKPQWTVYQDKPSISPSKSGGVSCVGVQNTATTKSNSSTLDIVTPEEKLPPLDANTLGLVHCNNLLLLQIREEVIKVLKTYNPKDASNGAVIGFMVKLNCDMLRKHAKNNT